MNDLSLRRFRPSGVAITASALAVTAGIVGGCVKKTPTLAKPPEASVSGAQTPGVELQIDDLRTNAKAFADLAKRVQGATPEQTRPLMQQAFASLVQILPQLAGQRQGGVFAHQLSVVEDARSQLASRSASLAAAPIIENGLLATRSALADAAQNYYFVQDPQIEQTLQQLAEKNNELRTAPGAAHALVTGDAAVLVSQVVSRMTEVLGERLSETPPPAATTAPAVPATPVPADAAPAAPVDALPAPADPTPPAVPPAPADAAPAPADPAAPPTSAEPAPVPPSDANK